MGTNSNTSSTGTSGGTSSSSSRSSGSASGRSGSGTIGKERPVTPSHAVDVAFTAWEASPVRVLASAGGGRGNLPYVAVTVGECLTYAYDSDAVSSYLAAWQDAARQNQTLRLPVLTSKPTPRTGSQLGQDLVVMCSAYGAQRRAVTSSIAPDGRGVLVVTVGAVTVRVRTSQALRAHLRAWTQAHALTGIFTTPQD